MSNWYDSIVSAIVNALTSKISSSITSHNSDLSAHSTLFAGKSNTGHTHISSNVTDLIDTIYPVGSIYMSVDSTSPATLFGGTWSQIEDTFLLAAGSSYSAGSTGGSADAVIVQHNHTQNQHRHQPDDSNLRFLTGDFNNIGRKQLGSGGTSRGYGWTTTSTSSNDALSADSYTDYKTPTISTEGESGAGKNMPPYLTVYVWKRIE